MAINPSKRPNAVIVPPACSVFRRHLRGVGLKYTTERADTLDAVTGFDRPFHVEALLERLSERGRRVSKATVYRTLKLLVDAGILAERPDARDCVRYELVHGRPVANVEIRTPDGARITLRDDRVAALADALCKSAGLTVDRQVLILEAHART